MTILKKLILFLSIISIECWANCTSPISRTNSSPNTVLTTSKYNNDLNTVYSHVNNISGSCLQDSSISAVKLDTTSLPPLVYAIKEGCRVSYSDPNTLSVGKCIVSVNGNYIKTTSNTTVTWGCSGCSAESSSSTFYVYATSSSPLTFFISTTAPGEDGYNGTSRVLGRFYNDASSNIDQYSVDQWKTNGFQASNAYLGSLTTACSWVSNTTCTGKYWRRGSKLIASVLATASGAPTATPLTFTIPSSLIIDVTKLSVGNSFAAILGSRGTVWDNSAGAGFDVYGEYQGTTTSVAVMIASVAATYSQRALVSSTVPVTIANLDTVSLEFEVPIVGWND
jgi:hypothetical protein